MMNFSSLYRPRLSAGTILSSVVLLSAVKTVLVLRMLTAPKQYVLAAGSTVELECQFYDDAFNLFDYPVVWHKKQRRPSQWQHHQHPQPTQQTLQQQRAHHHSLLLQPTRQHRRQVIDVGYEDGVVDQINLMPLVTSENEEDCQINMMGNLLDPFSIAKRYRASYNAEQPRHIFGLSLTDALPEDSANYTCQIDGPQNTIIGSVTHSVVIIAPVEEIVVSGDNWTTADDDVTYAFHGASGTLPTMMENLPSLIRCHVIGGGPMTDIRVHIGERDLTGEMTITRSSTVEGSRCMRRERFVATRWSHNVEVTSDDDNASVNCSVTVTNGQLPGASQAAILHVQYAPIITCDRVIMAEVDQMSVDLTCKIQARPEVTALYWMIDSSTGVVITEGVSMSEYSTTNMVLSESVLISKLRVRRTHPESFRTYTIFAENALAKESQDVILQRRPMTSTTTPSSGMNLPALPHVRGDIKRMAGELRNSALTYQRCEYVIIMSFLMLQFAHLWTLHP